MPSDVAANDPDRGGRVITLMPVGTGAAFGDAGDVQSSYLLRAGDRAVVLDLGSGAVSALAHHLPPEDLDAVVISHAHPDHCVDLFGLHVRMAWGPGQGRVIPVFGPEGLAGRLAAFSDSEPWPAQQGLRMEVLSPGSGEVDLGGGVRLLHREVPHLPPTHALRVEHGGSALCYSADCGPDDALVRLAHGCDVLLCECTFGPDPVPEGVPHLNGRHAGDIARRAGVGRLLLTHRQPGHDPDAALAQAREAFGGRVDWARPGREVRL